jgi:hypothetical protein
MPKIMLTVPEGNLSVTRPVVLDIVRQLMKDTGISAQTTIFYPGASERGAQPNSLISVDDESNMFPFNDRISIDVEENYNADRILSEAVHRPEHLFIFRDDAIETAIKPVYSMGDLVINFKYRAVDETSAKRWRDDMRVRIGMMKDERYHSVSYHYLIPPEFLVILEELHTLRETVAGYGDTFSEWLEANIASNATVFKNLAGEQGRWGISETQQRLVGYFDFDGTPEQGSKEDEGDTWTISVSYKVSFEKPIACEMAYPLMVHQQLVSHRPDDEPIDPNRYRRSYSATMDALRSFEKGTTRRQPMEGLAIPAFDEFVTEDVPSDTMRVATMLTGLLVDNPTLLLTTEEIVSIGLDFKILLFMAKEAPYMTKRYQSVFQLDLYKNHDILPQSLLEVDSDLNITVKEPLSLRDYHHVRLSVVKDLRLLPRRALDALRQDGKVCQLILEYIAPYLKDVGLIPDLLGGTYVTRSDMDAAIDAINAGIISKGNGQIYQFNTIGSIFVQAYKGS